MIFQLQKFNVSFWCFRRAEYVFCCEAYDWDCGPPCCGACTGDACGAVHTDPGGPGGHPSLVAVQSQRREDDPGPAGRSQSLSLCCRTRVLCTSPYQPHTHASTCKPNPHPLPLHQHPLSLTSLHNYTHSHTTTHTTLHTTPPIQLHTLEYFYCPPSSHSPPPPTLHLLIH